MHKIKIRVGRKAARTLIYCTAILTLISHNVLGQSNSAAGHQQNDSAQRIYRVAGNENYPPQVFLNEKNIPDGYDIDVLKEICRYTGIKADVHLNSWMTARHMLDSGKADILLGINHLTDREDQYDFTDSYLEIKTVIFVASRNNSIRSIYDLQGKNVAVQHGGLGDDYLTRQFQGIKILRYPNLITAINMLNSGKADAVVGNYYIGLYWLYKYGMNQEIKVVDKPILVTPYCMAVNKGDTELLSRLNAAISELKARGELRRLQKKWLEQNYFMDVWYEKNQVIQIIKYLGLFGSSVLLVSLAFLYFFKLKITRATSELKEVNRYYRALIDNASDIIIVIDRDGFISYHSPSFRKTFGYSATDIEKKNFFDIIYESDIKIASSILRNKNTGGRLITMRLKAKDGTVRICEAEVNSLLNDDAIRGIIINARDVTQRVNSQKEIRMLAQTIRNISECVCVTDMKNNIIFVNESFVKTYGYLPSEIIGEHLSIIYSENVPAEKYKEIYMNTLRGGWQGEVIYTDKNRREFPVSLSAALVIDDKDVPVGLVSVTTDISERKNTERELIISKEKAERSDRLKSEFLAQMSHEIRTPVNAILSFTSLLRDELENKVSDDLKSSFNIIDNGGRRLIRTIDMILNMSEIQAGNFEISLKSVDIYKDVLDGLLIEFANPARTKGLQLNICREADEHRFYGDVYTVTQIFQNLIDNAIKYTPAGSVTIRVTNTRKHELCVEVEDTGIGISSEYLPFLFDAFTQEDSGYTRKFEGNGLGLSLVKKYISLNNAEIKVESRKGKGTTFTVFFKI